MSRPLVVSPLSGAPTPETGMRGMTIHAFSRSTSRLVRPSIFADGGDMTQPSSSETRAEWAIDSGVAREYELLSSPEGR